MDTLSGSDLRDFDYTTWSNLQFLNPSTGDTCRQPHRSSGTSLTRPSGEEFTEEEFDSIYSDPPLHFTATLRYSPAFPRSLFRFAVACLPAHRSRKFLSDGRTVVETRPGGAHIRVHYKDRHVYAEVSQRPQQQPRSQPSGSNLCCCRRSHGCGSARVKSSSSSYAAGSTKQCLPPPWTCSPQRYAIVRVALRNRLVPRP